MKNNAESADAAKEPEAAEELGYDGLLDMISQTTPAVGESAELVVVTPLDEETQLYEQSEKRMLQQANIIMGKDHEVQVGNFAGKFANDKDNDRHNESVVSMVHLHP